MKEQDTITCLETIRKDLNLRQGSITYNAIDAAIISLKRDHIRKKVEYIADGYADGSLVYDRARCPCCNFIFEESDDNWEQPYCMYCGQSLDWAFEKEDEEQE